MVSVPRALPGCADASRVHLQRHYPLRGRSTKTKFAEYCAHIVRRFARIPYVTCCMQVLQFANIQVLVLMLAPRPGERVPRNIPISFALPICIRRLVSVRRQMTRYVERSAFAAYRATLIWVHVRDRVVQRISLEKTGVVFLWLKFPTVYMLQGILFQLNFVQKFTTRAAELKQCSQFCAQCRHRQTEFTALHPGPIRAYLSIRTRLLVLCPEPERRWSLVLVLQ